jgi:hypothetical protein
MNIDDATIGLSPQTYDNAVKELGVINNMTFCNSTKDIVFTLKDGFEFRVTPDDYLDRTVSSDGYCRFLGYKYDCEFSEKH